MSQYILSIDQGTTSSRVCLFNRSGQLVDQAQKEFAQIYPKSGWVEHDASEIWQTIVWCVKEILSRNNAAEISSVGITNQRETIVMWDSKTSEPIYNAIVWQCKRSEKVCASLRSKYQKTIRKKTGLVIDPYFSATKIKWILTHVPKAKILLKENRLRVGTIDSFLIWKLTNSSVHATDVSNASRTMLMNISTLEWDDTCCKIFGINKSILPRIKNSNSFFGFLTHYDLGIPNEIKIPIHGVLGDQQAALFGQACFEHGMSKCTFGTGSFILYNIGNKPIQSKSGLLTTIAWKIENQKVVYALEGGAFVCGAAVTWLKDNLNLITTSNEVEELANQVDSTEGVVFVSALSGLGAPYWKDQARGQIIGLTRKTNKKHLARATLESMALQNVDIIKAMEKESGRKLKELRTDGGASKNNLLMQMQSDFLNTKVIRAQMTETTALGVAFMSGLGSGFWKSLKEIEPLAMTKAEFLPSKNKNTTKEILIRWNRAIQNLIKGL